MAIYNSGTWRFALSDGVNRLNFYILNSRFDVSTYRGESITVSKQLKSLFYGVAKGEVFGRFPTKLGATYFADSYINYHYNNSYSGYDYVTNLAYKAAMLDAVGIAPSTTIAMYLFNAHVKGFTTTGSFADIFYILDEDDNPTANYIEFSTTITKDSSIPGGELLDQSYDAGTIPNPPSTQNEVYYWTINWRFNGSGMFRSGIPVIDSNGHVADMTVNLTGSETVSKNDYPWAIPTPAHAYVSLHDIEYDSMRMAYENKYWAMGSYDRNYIGLISNLLNNVVEEEPLDPMGETEFGDTWGAYDFTTEDVTQSSMLADMVLSSDMVKAYDVSPTDLTNLHTKLFSQNFIDNLVKSFNNPMQAVLKLHQIPIAPYSTTSGNIYLGNYDTEITADRLTSRWSEWDSGNMSGIFEQEFGLSYDYDIQYELYLPFVNCIPLAVDDVLNGTLSCHYRVDMLTGQFICWVEVTKYNTMGYPYTAIIYQTTGNMSADMPITSGGYDAMGIMQGAFNIAGNLAVTAATGGANLAAGAAKDMTASQLHASQFEVGMDAAQGVAGLVNSAKPQYSFRGGMGGVATMQGRRKPFVKAMIPHPRAPHNYKNIIGFPSHISDAIGNFSGYAIFKNVILDVPGITPTEEASIRNLLHSGVYIEGGSFATGSYLTDDVVLIQNASDDRTIGKTLTAVETINGKWKAELDTETPTIIIESTTSTSAFNYLYIKALDRFYFVRGKSYLKDGVLSLQLAEDVLETYKATIKSTNAYCVRSANKYNSLIQDTDAPLQVDKIIRYENFSNEFNSNHCILVTI